MFLDTVEKQFGSRDLYAVLGVERTAEEAHVRRAYRRLSLKVHPDRAAPEHVASATEKFQTLGKIYSILTDKDKRGVYDEDGTVDEEDSIFDQDRDWRDYWRLLFPRVTVRDIRSFEESYKGSGEEEEDLKKAYLLHQGDMDHIMEEVLCSSAEDEPRYRGLLAGWVAEGSLPDLPNFSQESEKKKRKRENFYKREAKGAKMMKPDSDGDLTALIAARQNVREQQMGNFFEQLEQKYAGNSSSSSSKGKGKTTSSRTQASNGVRGRRHQSSERGKETKPDLEKEGRKRKGKTKK